MPALGCHQTDPLYGVRPEAWEATRAAMRLKLSGGPHTFESACERLFGADERVSEGPSLLNDIQATNLSPPACMRGMFANEAFGAFEPVAVLGASDRTVADNDTRLWHRIGAGFYADEDAQSSGWLVNSNQGKVLVGDDGQEYDQFYDTNCAFAIVRYYSLVCGRRTWQSLVVVVTTRPVACDEEFVSHYPLPLSPPFLWADRFKP